MKTKEKGKMELMEIGEGAFEAIKELVENVENAKDDTIRDEHVQRIHEDPLSLEVRSGWYAPGTNKPEPEEYCILLSTGGPATRIIGELAKHGEPQTARLEAQDWGTPWVDTFQDEKVLLRYASNFYFGE